MRGGERGKWKGHTQSQFFLDNGDAVKNTAQPSNDFTKSSLVENIFFYFSFFVSLFLGSSIRSLSLSPQTEN